MEIKFKTNLRELRLINKDTQEQLIEKLKQHGHSLTVRSLQLYESGYRIIKADTLLAVAEIYGVETDYILGRTTYYKKYLKVGVDIA